VAEPPPTAGGGHLGWSDHHPQVLGSFDHPLVFFIFIFIFFIFIFYFF